MKQSADGSPVSHFLFLGFPNLRAKLFFLFLLTKISIIFLLSFGELALEVCVFVQCILHWHVLISVYFSSQRVKHNNSSACYPRLIIQRITYSYRILLLFWHKIVIFLSHHFLKSPMQKLQGITHEVSVI